MSNEKIQTLLRELHQELSTATLDEETLNLLQGLDSDINNLLDPNLESVEAESLVETAKFLETQFAIKHPLAERCVREIIDALARMGI